MTINSPSSTDQENSWRGALIKSPGPESASQYLILYLKAFCMGIADLVPGVSGGTIAFVTGIYDDILSSIGRVDKNLLRYVLKGQLKQALAYLPVRFLMTLFGGILSAIFSLAHLMHYLMNHHGLLTWATFCGLITASIVVVAKQIDQLFETKKLIFLGFGIVIGYLMVSLVPVSTPNELWFIFVCGIIGITAMILPGLSGSFLLLILGKYEYITSAIKAPFAEDNFKVLFIFSCGTLVGLLSFTKVLNAALKNYHAQTMAFLSGLLIGTLKKLWPWKEVLETKVIRGKVRILKEANVLPAQYDMEFFMVLLLMLTGFGFVLFLEYLSSHKKNSY